MLPVKAGHILREDESILGTNFRFSAGPEGSKLLRHVWSRILPLEILICKYLITSDLRLGSSVGRAVD
jgi:hypothetical protein